MSTKNANGKGMQNAATQQENAPVKSVEPTKTPQPGAAIEPIAPPKENKPPSVEDKINKVESLTKLIEQRAILKAHLTRIDSLKFGDFDEKDCLTITSKSGNSYAIANSALMSDIAKLCKEKLSAKILQVEQLIEF